MIINCIYCNNTYTEENDHPDHKIDTHSCKRCWPISKVGKKIKYSAWDRPPYGPSESVFADKHLTRNELYTIARIHRSQHMTHIELKEFPGKQGFRHLFSLNIFTPVEFVRPGAEE